MKEKTRERLVTVVLVVIFVGASLLLLKMQRDVHQYDRQINLKKNISLHTG